jgi:hypothetical protein
MTSDDLDEMIEEIIRDLWGSYMAGVLDESQALQVARLVVDYKQSRRVR